MTKFSTALAVWSWSHAPRNSSQPAPRATISWRAWCWCVWLMCGSLAAVSQVNVLTRSYDNARTGANLQETILTPANVNSTNFGKLFTFPTDGQIYAQPLYVANLAIAGGTHNVVYVASMLNTIYALDADTGAVLWTQNYGSPIIPQDVETDQNIVWNTRLGILATPVIDPATNIMYFVTGSQPANGALQFAFNVNAIDITTGLAVHGSPVNISATYTTADLTNPLVFNARIQNPRPGLALGNGQIYVAFASHEDQGPYHGFVLAYSTSTLAQTAVYSDTTTGTEGGIWNAGQAPAIDAAGNIYISTGNGSFGKTPNNLVQTGNSFIKLSPKLELLDYFTPFNSASMNGGDQDLGSSGLLLIPNTSYMLGGGKQGVFYLVDSTAMGSFNASVDQVKQEFQAVYGKGTSHIHGGPVYFAGTDNGPSLYNWGENDVLRAFAFNPVTGLINTTPFAMSTMTAPVTNNDGAMPGGFLSVSANGNSHGIVWASTPYNGDAVHHSVEGVLYAFDADTLKLLWSDKQNDARDDVGVFAKYVPPVVANGKLYVATFGPEGVYDGKGQLNVYGLLQPGLDIAVNNATMTAGAPLPALTGTVTGLQNGDTLGGTIIVTYSTTATSNSAAGTYPITATVTGASANNYRVELTAGTLTISAATLALTVTANNATRVYGAANPALTGTVTGAQGNDTFTESFSTPAIATSNVGSYPVVPAVTGANLANYTVTTLNGALTVMQAPLNATANNVSRVYGAANPAFTGSVTGAAGGDTFTESFATVATATSNVGIYPIVPAVSGPSLANYSVTPVNGALTVSGAPTTTTLTAPATAGLGANVILAAAVTTGAGTPTGSVTFSSGLTTLGTATLTNGLATLSTSALPAGTDSVIAAFLAAGNYSGSTSAASIITVSSSAQTITFAALATRAYGSSPFAVTATSSLGSSYPVTVTVQSGPAVISGGLVTVTGAGTVTLLATQAGDSRYSAATATQSFLVTPADTTTTLSVPASAVQGANVTMTATVQSAAGVPGGSVTFYNGATSLGAVPLSGGVATLSTTALPVGSDLVSAAYAAAGNFAASSSAALTLPIAMAPSGPPAGYTVAATPASLDVKEGMAASTTLTFTSTGGYTGTIALSCSNLPPNAVCSFAQTPLTLNGDNKSVGVALTIKTTKQQAAGQAPYSPLFALAFWWPWGPAVLARRRSLPDAVRRYRLGLLIAASCALAAGLSGCGMSGVTTRVVAPSVSQVTVTATGTSGGAVTTQTAVLTLNVTP